MRTTTDTARLRRVAATLLVAGAGCVTLDSLLAASGVGPGALLLAGDLLGLLLLAVGLAFWVLGQDQRGGVVIDNKGLLLNLGHSSAFVAWENIERAGGTSCFTSVLMLGSRRQLGIALRDTRPYIQSYEERMPGHGPIRTGLRLVQQALRARHPLADEELALHLAGCRQRTGYDVLVPEALLGRSADAFARQIEERRVRVGVPLGRSTAQRAPQTTPTRS
jgi:hypothetical protein